MPKTKIMATLVDAKSYSIVTKAFEEGIPAEVTAAEKAMLSKVTRTFSDPQNPDKKHVVQMFNFEDVIEPDLSAEDTAALAAADEAAAAVLAASKSQVDPSGPGNPAVRGRAAA